MVGLYLLVYEIPTPLLIIGFLAAMQILANNRFEVRGSFLDIGRIVDQHCSIFLFIMKCD
jgi:hypothetical protein